MMTKRVDSLGRRIPEFDRSAAGKAASKTAKENNGIDYHARVGANGGRVRSRGYFGKLKDEGKIDELKKISREAADKSAKRSPEERSKAVKKAWQTRRTGRPQTRLRKTGK